MLLVAVVPVPTAAAVFRLLVLYGTKGDALALALWLVRSRRVGKNTPKVPDRCFGS